MATLTLNRPMNPERRAKEMQPDVPVPETAPDADEDVVTRIWRQVENGLDVERLLPSLDKRTREVAKKLDREIEHNGWRKFVSNCAYAMANGKAPQKRNAEVTLITEVTRWRRQVLDLLPDREPDFRRIVEAGLARPEPPTHKNR